MRLQRGLFCVLLALICMLVPQGGMAENLSSSFTLTPFAGGYGFSEEQNLKDSGFFGAAVGYNLTANWGAEAVFGYASTETETGATDDVDYFAARLDLLYHLQPESRFVPYFAVGAGEAFISPEKIAGESDFIVGYGAGAKLFLNDTFALRLDLRHLLDINDVDKTRSKTTVSNVAAYGGLMMQFGGLTSMQTADQDGDGVTDAYDRCPDTATGISVDGWGCPLDSDRDGIADYLDACPATPLGATVDRRGCPLDSDRDGVADYRDQCSETPAQTEVDERGCPANDHDSDGVLDEQDRCPNTPQNIPVNDLGCPKDEDGDGIFDFEDACLDSPGDQPVNAKGCPVDEMVEDVVPQGDTLVLNLEYPTGESAVTNEFIHDLQVAADLIQAHPDKRFVIEGHTDSVGPAAANLRLSQKRADKIRAYLVESLGIPAERLEAKGMGESQPVGDNATQQGRKSNRRVVILPIP
ncbi:MAG: hypothetical protein C0621_04175 [Desulfuromonas sp.]|nr:MAG: hypothetical protein C0621_04175 [Desulfuromonas sp.]